jgi:hypothetical protein
MPSLMLLLLLSMLLLSMLLLLLLLPTFDLAASAAPFASLADLVDPSGDCTTSAAGTGATAGAEELDTHGALSVTESLSEVAYVLLLLLVVVVVVAVLPRVVEATSVCMRCHQGLIRTAGCSCCCRCWIAGDCSIADAGGVGCCCCCIIRQSDSTPCSGCTTATSAASAAAADVANIVRLSLPAVPPPPSSPSSAWSTRLLLGLL